MVDRGSIIWLVVSLASAVAAGFYAYADPAKFMGVVDLLATIISILVGVSLAVIAVLTSPFTVSQDFSEDREETRRVDKLVANDDEALASGQLLFFWVYFVSLGCALVFSWLTTGDEIDFAQGHLKWWAGITAAIGVFAFAWSARLPVMLKRIAKLRRTLG